MISPTNSCANEIKTLHASLSQSVNDIIALAHSSSHPIQTHWSNPVIPIYSALISQKTNMVFLVLDSSLRTATQIQAAIHSWSQVFNIPSDVHLLFNTLSEQEKTGLVNSALSQAYHHLLSAAPGIFILPSHLLNSLAPSLVSYQKHTLELHTGEAYRPHDIVVTLTQNGYTRYSDSLEPGGFRLRGDELDVWHPLHQHPYTISFYGNIIDRLVSHQDQRRTNLTRLILPPVIIPEDDQPFTSFFTQGITLHPASTNLHLSSPTIIYNALHPDLISPLQIISKLTTTHSSKPIVIWYENHDRIHAYITDHNLTTCLIPGNLSQQKFLLTTDKCIFTSEAQLLPEPTVAAPISYHEGLALLAQLQPGQPAVHCDHGIGIYEGLQSRTIDSITKDYLVLRYAGHDTVSVPVEYAHKITAYLGDTQPTIHRLGGIGWRKSRRQAEIDAAAFAQELLETAGHRQGRARPPYYLDPSLDHQLSTSFSYDLTPDQAQAWSEIKHDLEQSIPMDRLVVGDVGFGKTEIAIRAARHAVANGYQVAILAPTTLLVQQHADTLLNRLPELAPNIGTLSRFTSPQQQNKTRAAITDGTIKIAVGTHALLSKTTKWHKLGLVIIDEEQRFGVKHKEHFKKIRANLDILSLSATPIPRTLSMSLTGLKSLSLINTAPPGRKSVITNVHSYQDHIIQEAVTRELKRGGQVYVVAPRIQELGHLAHTIQKLVPTASVSIAHGQLPPVELARIMQKFDTGKLDVLVSSTIIENGIDLPNANTLIVTKATHYGLSDLYQLRGRVGRRQRQGYAYFLYHQTNLTSEQRQRLTALTEASRLGSGWSLAQRDLEIRGAGNLLGAEQSGSVNAVGIQFYLDLVQDFVHHQITGPSRRDIEISVPFSTAIPEHYIADSTLRVHTYQRLARARDLASLNQETNQLIQKYGPLPPETIQLILILTLQHHAVTHGITRLTYQEITPSDEDPYYRLILTVKNPVALLQTIGSLGNWQASNQTLSLGVDQITPNLINRLVDCLK